jgi:hypothetical protein
LGTAFTVQNCKYEGMNGRLGVVESRVLRTMFVSKKDKVPGDNINCTV